MTTYLIIGNGVAGTSAAEAIRKADPHGNITIVTAEDTPFYYRIKLPEIISGEAQEEALIAKPAAWYAEKKITLHLNTVVQAIAPSKKEVQTTNGTFFYDKLLLATGSYSFAPPIPGAEAEHVFTLRNMQDARMIRHAAKNAQHAVLIGGGLLGLEAGFGLIKQGLRPTIVEFFPRLLPRQLDEEGASRLQRQLEKMGFSFRLGAVTKYITTDHILLENGENIPANMVLISAGVRPEITLAEQTGITVQHGIVVNNSLQTNVASIYAAGDVAEHNGKLYGIWTAALQQGKQAGNAMAEKKAAYTGTIMANTLKVVGIDLASAGNIDAEEKYDAVISATESTYRKLVLHDGVPVGVIMLGNTKNFYPVTRKIQQGEKISPRMAKELVTDI